MKTILGFRSGLDGALQDQENQRAAAFAAFYKSLGVAYQVVGLPTLDLPLESDATGARNGYDRGVTAVRELELGQRAALHPATCRHFHELVEGLQPKAVQLEGPFMWPVVARLRRDGVLAGIPLIYSSHQYEAVARIPVLKSLGVSESVRRRAARLIEEVEAEICRNASVVTVASKLDALAYVALGTPEQSVHVIPEGAARLTLPEHADQWSREFEGRSPLLFSGPDAAWAVDDFLRLAAPEGLFFAPPEKMLAVYGDISNRIFQSSTYQKFLHGNSERVMFFPSMSEAERTCLRIKAKGILLPIETGVCSGPGAADALVAGKWLVATSNAMRRHPDFQDAAGVLIADTPKAFRAAMLHAMNAPPPALSAEEAARREALYWDRCFEDSGFSPLVA